MTLKNLSFLVLFLLAGIILIFSHPLPWWTVTLPFLSAGILYLWGVYVSLRNPFRLVSSYNLLSACLLCFGMGMFSATLRQPFPQQFIAGEYYLKGRVKDFTPIGNGDKVLVDISELYSLQDDKLIPISLRNISALLTVRYTPGIHYGAYVSGKVELSPINTLSNYKKSDYERYLKSKNILMQGFTGYMNFSKNESLTLDSQMKSVRDEVEIFIENTHLQPNTKNFLIAILLGDNTALSKEEKLSFSDAGVAHIFAVSGLHVSLVGAIIFGTISIFFFGKRRKWTFLICIPLIWFYVLLVGPSPSTCRAGIMLSLGFSALFLQRKNNSLKNLLWSVFIIILLYPPAVYDIGFQLSIVCVGGIIMLVSPFNFMSQRRHPYVYKCVSVLLVTLVATFSSWLVSAYYFHKISLIFLPLNLLFVPLLPALLLLSFVFLAMFSLGIELSFLGTSIDYIYDCFSRSASYLASLSYSIDKLYPGIIAIVLWIIGLIIMGIVLNKNKKQIRLGWTSLPFFIASFIFLFMFPNYEPNGFIIQKNNREATVMSYTEGNELLINIPSQQSSMVKINGNYILTLDRSELDEESQRYLPQADFIMLIEGCKILPELSQNNMKKNCTIVTHPTIHWKYEKNIISEAEEKGLKLHSLRYDGPLHVFD